MKLSIAALLLSILVTPLAHAVSCGTLAAPTSCTVTTGGRLYTFTAFTLVESTAGGGAAFPYTASDLTIDIGSDAAGAAVLTFARLGMGPLLVNAGETRGGIITYAVTVSNAQTGIVSVGTPFTVGLGPSSQTNNGAATFQFIPTFNGQGISCVATFAAFGNCVIPAGKPLSFTAGNIFNMTGNAGTASVFNFKNLIRADFVPLALIDIDGNGTEEALTDGLLVTRYLLGLRGSALVTGAVGAGARRDTSQIEQYLQTLVQ